VRNRFIEACHLFIDFYGDNSIMISELDLACCARLLFRHLHTINEASLIGLPVEILFNGRSRSPFAAKFGQIEFPRRFGEVTVSGFYPVPNSSDRMADRSFVILKLIINSNTC
jgi:hypothetical protein